VTYHLSLLLAAAARIVAVQTTLGASFRRLHRSEESRLTAAAAYALPRELGGLSRGQIRALIRDVTRQAGASPTATSSEDNGQVGQQNWDKYGALAT
jgi:hypothetical protein